jgi:inosine/guanosine/xanthosine phosphorylase family protein
MPDLPAVDRTRPIPPEDQPARLAALAAAVRLRSDVVPVVGMVLGSGLGDFANEIEDPTAIPFEDLPGWPVATAPGHIGRLILGTVEGVPVIAVQGRFHLYEGNAPGLVVQPVLLFRELGARLAILTNAAGGVNPDYGAGTLMLISDHLNLTGVSPLIGQNADTLGDRFPDLTDVWSPVHRAALRRAGEAEGVDLEEGVYAGLIGPNYETPAEVRMLRTLGADAVGMSTVHETTVARHCGLRVVAISAITNLAQGMSDVPLSHEQTLRDGERAAGDLSRLLLGFLARIGGGDVGR